MKRLGIWDIQENGPKRIDESNINLESWIEQDSALAVFIGYYFPF